MIRLNAKSKYGAKQITVNGQRFDSQGEALRFQELRYMALAGEISGLECQVPYPLHADGGAVVGKYVADFRYRIRRSRAGSASTCRRNTGITVVVTRQGRRSRKPRARKRG